MGWYILKQTWIASGVLMNFLGIGMVLAYTSSLLPALRAGDSPVKVDLESEAWLSSILAVFNAPSMIATSIAMDRCGRKKSSMLCSILNIIGWLLIYWGNTLSIIIFGRFINGVAISSAYASGCVVIAEYTAPEYRGLFLNMKSGITHLGLLLMHIIGHYYSWSTAALIGTIPSVIALVNNFTWSESPSWLLKKNRFDEFEDTFYRLRGRDQKSVKEFESMIQAQKTRASETPQCKSYQKKITNLLKKFKQKSFIQPLSIFFFCVVLKEAAGRHFLPVYASDIIDQITTDKSRKFLMIILVDIVTLVGSTISCILTKYMGRKTLFMLSGIPASAILISLSLSLYMVSIGSLEVQQVWVFPSMLCSFAVFANIGCSSVPLVVFGEILPLPHRELGTAVGGCFIALAFFFSLHFLPKMLVAIKAYGTFAVFGVCLIASLVFLHFVMPETKDRTLQEIEDYFDHGRFFDNESERHTGDDGERMIMINPLKTSIQPKSK